MGVRFKIRSQCVFLSILLLCLGNGYSHAQSADAPLDTTPPIIELEELAEGTADRTQVFTAQIAEDNELQSVTLYYRRAGQLPYSPAPMESLGTTGYFSVSIPTDFNDVRTIEYYVQAQDESGNRTVSGYAFDPYQRLLAASAEPIETTATATAQPAIADGTVSTDDKPPLLKRRWFQITLGVIAAGVIASAAQDSEDDSEIVPLTFNVQ
ncbi:hypothetical protein IMCC3135_03925 [Granulosicoccus antarcticus IMCC3135]|uniref:Ig-like domain-containing protein n=1 Tax=Granulosicoccus antarcticus IMCC3135 TaxID=1192854 RepID=A0A2Z2NM88_9GAMM|nr:hypothetical protein IMCC3135_03925 [Granulosicoccus antarcticus IMCC3135]